VLSFPCYFVESTQSQKDKFETLCRVEADVSSAPLTSKLVGTGKMGYKRHYEIILLVGLTELKAQVGWVDSETVRAHPVLHITVDLIRLPHTWIQGEERRFAATFFEFLLRRLNSILEAMPWLFMTTPRRGSKGSRCMATTCCSGLLD